VIAAVVVLLAQAASILIVRHLVQVYDAFRAGVDVGRRSGAEASEPFKEAYQIGYDLGYERGTKDALTDKALEDLSLDELERLTTRLFKATAARYDALNEDTGTDCEADR
jgi:hypothetical protein